MPTLDPILSIPTLDLMPKDKDLTYSTCFLYPASNTCFTQFEEIAEYAQT